MKAHHWTLALCLLSQVAGAPAWAAVFEPNDVLISDPSEGLTDPEFDPMFFQTVWQDAGGNLWLADVDPVTGAMSPTSGKGELVDSGLASIFMTGNGPEFAYGNGKRYITYTRSIGGLRAIATAKQEDNGVWTADIEENGEDRWRPIGTFFGTPDAPRTVYAHELPTGESAVSWRVMGDASSEKTFPGFNVGGRWVGTTRAFILWGRVGNVNQLFWIDIDTGAVEQVSYDADDKNTKT